MTGKNTVAVCVEVVIIFASLILVRVFEFPFRPLALAAPVR
jgi:hypothetical protein